MKTLRKLFICLVLSLIVLAAAAPAFAQGFKWWQTERFQKELALTTEQITRIEGIYQTTEPLLRAQKQAIDRREEKLSKVIQDPKSDEADAAAGDRSARSGAQRSQPHPHADALPHPPRPHRRTERQDQRHARPSDRAEREKSERERKGNNKGPGQDDHNHSDCQ